MKFEIESPGVNQTVNVNLVLPEGYSPTLVKKRSKAGRYQFKVTVDTNYTDVDDSRLQEEIAKILRTAFADRGAKND